MNDIVTIIVRPATRREWEAKSRPLSAFVLGGATNDYGAGHTVLEAIEDLFTSAKVGRYCADLNRAVQHNEPPR